MRESQPNVHPSEDEKSRRAIDALSATGAQVSASHLSFLFEFADGAGNNATRGELDERTLALPPDATDRKAIGTGRSINDPMD
jgi:hypothetical protein